MWVLHKTHIRLWLQKDQIVLEKFVDKKVFYYRHIKKWFREVILSMAIATGWRDNKTRKLIFNTCSHSQQKDIFFNLDLNYFTPCSVAHLLHTFWGLLTQTKLEEIITSPCGLHCYSKIFCIIYTTGLSVPNILTVLSLKEQRKYAQDFIQ